VTPVARLADVTSTGVHLRRTDENVAEIAALVERDGDPVGVPGVLAELDRTAERVPVPGRAVEWGLRWAPEDVASAEWWPQGVTNSAHVPGFGDRRLLVTSWYAKGGGGSRVTVLDLDSLRYRHVLLVVPTLEHGEVRLQPLTVHAGGLVWCGPYLHVAGTRRGLFTCRLDDILQVEPGEQSLGHRYVLPVRFAYRGASEEGTSRLRFSFFTIDRSGPDPALVVGEYGSPKQSRRIARFALDPATHLLVGDDDGRFVPEIDERGRARMQGVAVVDGVYYATASRTPVLPGSVYVGTPGSPGSWVEHRRATPMGPEDIAYWPSTDRFWSVSEHPGRRWVFAMERSFFSL